ncbi:MAG: acetoacetate decarboxylase family protein [Rhodococcus sp.]|uniref:acetoacetate decarboxylase family protein n=1 Tax=Rhodococcus sp. TaxID=1831 RepID=UPI00169C4BED|nr:acetoacetate decarboxylase family protein [Rhodococcus sp. (in: high G+C Gram-positive bacteria)]NLV80789.1 acetoacetate decarboxylase family protein [Rhodococcus sp. (in: high G+C Gram-positive bacteria)]
MWSVPESRDDCAHRPVSPPPPWPATVRATLWWHRSTADAADHGPGGATIPVTLAMVVDYLDSPVGPYREILASPVLRRGLVPAMAVPFIAVDSAPSVHGGREHWLLPKVLASFTGDVLGSFCATGDTWRVATRAAPRGPRLPIAGRLAFAQPAPGRATSRGVARLRGRFRYARVVVDADGPTLSRWLRPGTHRGIVIDSGRMATGPARVR